MTMLQTGLKILAAKPEIGQSALSTIAAPLASGVEQYRGEKQKEAESRKAEAEAARTDKYRQAEAARSTAGLAAQLRQQDLQASIAEAQLTQSAAQHGQSVSLQKMDLLRKIEDDRLTNTIRQASTPEARMKLMDSVSDELQKVETQLQDPKLSAGQRQLLENLKARKERNLSYLQGTARTEMQSDTSEKLAARRTLTQIDLQIAKLGSGIPTPETTKALADLKNKRREIAASLGEGGGGPSSLPPPP
jgi:putative ABC transport system permease protein